AYIKTRPPIAVDPSGQPLTGPKDEDDEEDYEELRRLTMEPKWCFGKQGPLYMVACAVNGSIYGEQGFKGFTAGQKAAPPPFNDSRAAIFEGFRVLGFRLGDYGVPVSDDVDGQNPASRVSVLVGNRAFLLDMRRISFNPKPKTYNMNNNILHPHTLERIPQS
ncbi:unnamed protein product, partial [Symbiodinium sp. CCMP2456]